MDTKRTRIHHSRRRVLACSGLLGLLLTACDDPVAALIGVTAVSTNPSTGPVHTHRCSIPSSDLQDPPGNVNTYVSTTTQAHSHVVTLSRSDLMTLNEPNGSVNIQSESAGDPPHTHNFIFNH